MATGASREARRSFPVLDPADTRAVTTRPPFVAFSHATAILEYRDPYVRPARHPFGCGGEVHHGLGERQATTALSPADRVDVASFQHHDRGGHGGLVCQADVDAPHPKHAGPIGCRSGQFEVGPASL